MHPAEAVSVGEAGVASDPTKSWFPRKAGVVPTRSVASLNRCKFAAALRFPGVSLGGGDLLVEGVWVGLSVFDSVEVLAVELGERRAV